MRAWKVLGLAPTTEAVAIKRAYAKALKQHRPDEDPAGYQRLRECYEWALEWASAQSPYDDDDDDDALELAQAPAQHSEPASLQLGQHQRQRSPEQSPLAGSDRSPLDAAPLSIEAPAAGAEDGAGHGSTPMAADTNPLPAAQTQQDADAEPAEFIHPAELVGSLHQHWQQNGDAALLEAMPALMWRLQQIPLPLQEETCWRFAQWVAYEPTLPAPMAEALQLHFQWGLDYRIERTLGPELGEALRQRLRALGLPRLIDPRLKYQIEPLRMLLRRRNAQPGWRVLAFALSLPGRLPHLLSEIAPELLMRLGLDLTEQGMLSRLMLRGELGMQLLLALGLMGLAALGGEVESGARAVLLAAGLLIAAMTGIVVTGLSAVMFDRTAAAITSAVPGMAPTGVWRQLLGLLLCPVLAFSVARLPGPAATLLMLGGGLMALLLCWSPAARWRGLLLPLTILLAVTLSALLPSNWPNSFSTSLALLWVLLAHLGLLHMRGLMVLYREPLVLLPRGVGAWIALALFFKGVLGLLAASLVVLTPMSLLVQSLRQGALRVGGWLGMCLLLVAMTRAEPLLLGAIVLLGAPLLWLLITAIARTMRVLAGGAPR